MFDNKSMFGIDVSLSPSVESVVQEKNIPKHDIVMKNDEVEIVNTISDNSPSKQKDQVFTDSVSLNNNQNFKQKEYKSDFQLDKKTDQHDDEFLY